MIVGVTGSVGKTGVKEALFEAFDRLRPRVLVLAFQSLTACEECYLDLYRRSATIHAHVHRSIALCSRDEVKRAFDACMRGTFDAYAGAAQLLFVARSLERIGDHATNVAEMVHYAATGKYPAETEGAAGS